MFRAGLIFAGACGVFAETLEIARLTVGGVSAIDWPLRLVLVAAYAAVAAAAFGVARLTFFRVTSVRVLALILFGAFLFLPWFNFDFFPNLASQRSFVGSLVTLVVIVCVARGAMALPRASIVGVLAFAVAANAWGALRGTRESQRAIYPSQPNSPNVVVLLVDTLRADHIGAYGYDLPTTPEVDKLAAGSVVFENAISQAAWTKPAVASLFTGTFVHRHGVIRSRDALGPDLPTLAEEMRRRGYTTAGFSSNPWITEEFGFARGFEEFHGTRAMGMQLTNLYRVAVRLERRLIRAGLSNDLSGVLLRGAGRDNPTNAERDAALTEKILQWIGSRPANPFFLYIHLIGAHDPYDPPPEFARLFKEDPDRQGPTLPPPRVQSIFDTAEAMAAPDLAALIAQYDGAVRYSDMLVGRIRSGMEKYGLLEGTLFVLLADHGEEFYEHRNWRHGNQLYQEVIHIPLIFRRPGPDHGERRPSPAMLIDVYPSIMGFVDASFKRGDQNGRDLFAPDSNSDIPAYAEHRRYEGGEYVSRAVVHHGLKLIDTSDSARGVHRQELFNLGEDPGETVDQRVMPDLVDAEDVVVLQSRMAEFGAVVRSSGASIGQINEKTKEDLRNLGYKTEER